MRVQRETLYPSENEIWVPEGAEFLSVDNADEQFISFNIYYLCDPLRKTSPRSVLTVRTSESFQKGDRQFLGSVVLSNGTYHVFVG